MKLYNNEDIRKLDPCYDPIRYCSDDKEYTLMDILDREDIPLDDRIWVVTQLIPEKEARLFAVWCAREALKLVGNPDPRSTEACDVAERFAHGKATKDELEAARSAAWAAWGAASNSAWEATRCAAWSAAYAVRSAAWSAKAASCAVRAAARTARAAAAGGAARKKQIDKLREIVIGIFNACNKT